MGRLLARLPYDAKLADSASVIQAPVMWVKYPPNILTMTRVELFDAIQLIDEWVARGHDHYVAEVKAVRQQLRARAHALTTPSEYSTFRRYVKFPPNRLAQGYEWAIQHIVSDRRELSFISLDAIDEVVQDRFPGATWSASARSWIEGYLREEDRRAQRVDSTALVSARDLREVRGAVEEAGRAGTGPVARAGVAVARPARRGPGS